MDKLKELYKTIWQERPHICENCGYPISRPIAHVFSHKKSKGSHPELKYDKDNIELLCSSWIRQDNKIGCHEAHHQKPEIFKKRSLN